MYRKIIRAFYIYKINKFCNNYNFYKSIVEKCDYILKNSKTTINVEQNTLRYIFVVYTIHILTNSDSTLVHNMGLFLLIDISDLFLNNIEIFKEDIEKLRYLDSLKDVLENI